METVECPYCNEPVRLTNENRFADDANTEQECDSCDKMFMVRTAVHCTYTVRAAECLNGAPHKLERTSTYPPEFARLRCKDCDYERAIPATEVAQGEQACHR